MCLLVCVSSHVSCTFSLAPNVGAESASCVHCSFMVASNSSQCDVSSVCGRKWPEKVLCRCSWWKADTSVSHHTQHDISILHPFSFVRCRFAAIVFFGTDKVRGRTAFVILCLFLRANVIILHVQARVRHPC